MMMKTIYHITAASKPFKQAILALLLILSIAGCKKDSQLAPAGTDDGRTIKYVLNDNFNFSQIYFSMGYVGLQDSLAKPGPYTFLATDNTAFTAMNLSNTINIAAFYTASLMANIIRYSTIPASVVFKSIPLVQNKPYKTLTGGNVYVSKYLDGADTVTTVNGLKLISMDNAASNGFIQVIPQILNPELFHNAVTYIHSDTTLSLFAAAMQRAKLDVSLLGGTDEYTLLAPSNTALQQSARLGKNLGVSTLDSILIADPDKLAAFLMGHLIKGRYFEGDLYRYAAANPAGIAMLNGSKVIIGGNPAGFHAITFLGNGNKGIASVIATPTTYNPTVNYASIPCGNGVVHIINRVLIP